jgi:hypothetical protein
MQTSKRQYLLPLALRRQLLMPLALIAACGRAAQAKRVVRKARAIATCNPGRPKMRLKKTPKRPAMPRAPLQMRKWISSLAGVRPVKARTKSEARAMFKKSLELATSVHFDRLPPGTILIAA